MDEYDMGVSISVDMCVGIGVSITMAMLERIDVG